MTLLPCVDTQARSNLTCSVEGTGEAAKLAEERKKSSTLKFPVNLNLYPLVWKSLARLALRFFNSLARALVEETIDIRAG